MPQTRYYATTLIVLGAKDSSGISDLPHWCRQPCTRAPALPQQRGSTYLQLIHTSQVWLLGPGQTPETCPLKSTLGPAEFHQTTGVMLCPAAEGPHVVDLV